MNVKSDVNAIKGHLDPFVSEQHNITIMENVRNMVSYFVHIHFSCRMHLNSACWVIFSSFC